LLSQPKARKKLRIYGNKLLSRIFEITGRATLHNEELHKLYSSPNINRAIKSRKMEREMRETFLSKTSKNKASW
jgi:hypothetical protein